MAREILSDLAPAPGEVLDLDASPRLGTFHGSFRTVDWGARLTGLKGLVRRVARRKRWVWAGIATKEVYVAFAIVDVGYASNAFAFVVDLQRGALLSEHSFLGRPGAGARVGDRPGEGARFEFAGVGGRLRLIRPEGTASWVAEVEAGDLRLEALLDTAEAPPPAAIVMKVLEGDVTATQKANLLPSTGKLRAGGRIFDLAGGFGGLDYSNGLLGRTTAWRWAFGLGRTAAGIPLGFNLSDGLSVEPGQENVMWVGKALHKVGPARFTFDAKHPDGAWQVRTEDGHIDLRFAGKGMHAEARNLAVVRSRFAQVAGSFTGTVRIGGVDHALENLPGVTEDQYVVW